MDHHRATQPQPEPFIPTSSCRWNSGWTARVPGCNSSSTARSEGEFIDPIPAVPDGSGITLVCNTQNGSPQEIRDIEVLEFDDVRDRHHSEERGDPTIDSLISREDDRWGGHLMEIRKTG